MPFKNEHAARVIDPKKFKKDSFRRKNIADGIDVIMGKLLTQNAMAIQSYRFYVSNFSIQSAKKWLSDNNIKYILFEPAMKEKRDFSGYLRFLGERKTKDKRIITVGIVSERIDSYNTIIKPDGLISPVESVIVDYNHNRISTGADVFDKGIQEIEINVNGKNKKVQSRVVEIHVYKDSRLWDRENKDNRAEDVPNAYEAVENGRLKGVSVDFSPVESAIEIVTDVAGNKIKEVYNQWRLNFLSLLDTKGGQDDSYFLNVRMTKDNNLSKKREMAKKKVCTREELSKLVTRVSKVMGVSEDEARKALSGFMSMDSEDEKKRDFEEVDTKEDKTNESDGKEKNDKETDIEESEKDEDKNIDEETEEEIEEEIEKEDVNVEDTEEEENDDIVETEKRIADLEKEVKDLTAKNEKITELYNRISKSPTEIEGGSNDSATDLESDGEDADDELQEWREERERILYRNRV